MNSMSRFIIQKIKGSILIAAPAGVAAQLIWGPRVLLNFCIGFIMGALNFSLLSHGLNLLMGINPRVAGRMHSLLFAIRYGIIGIVFFELVKHKEANILALVLGLIVINISIVMGEFKRRPSLKGGV